MARYARMIMAVVVGILASVAIATPAAADVDDFTFDSLTADYTLTRAADGSSRLTVVEEFVARFPEIDQNRGMRRVIPDTYNGQPLHPELISITDGQGADRPSETDAEDGMFAMTSRADGYVHGAQTYVFTYTLQHVTWTFGDTGQEFYWDVNGVDWLQPFGEITARLHVDGDVADALTGRTACYADVQDGRTPCDGITVEAASDGGAVITARATSVAPYETLTMAVGFADGTFVVFDTSFLASPIGWAQGVAGVGLLGAGAFALRSRRRWLRDEPGRPTIIAEYTPPPGVDALEGAVLLGKQAKAIPAEVLEQAVVGSIRILEGSRRMFGGTRLTAELVDPSRADGDGRMLLQGLFPAGRPGEQYEFGRQDTRLSKVAQSILKAAETELTNRGLRRVVPVGARLWPILVTVVVAGLVFLFGILAYDGGVRSPWPFALIVLAGFVAVAVIIVVAHKPLTRTGAEVRDHLRGLKIFIEWAEADRIRMLQSPAGAERVRVAVDDPREMLRLYETLLPYAVVFGQEKEWSKQLAVLYTATGAAGPVWYAGTGSFDAGAFSAGIGSLSAAASSSSSTSGGSGGGGSAGGGGGGGGGGGV